MENTKSQNVVLLLVRLIVATIFLFSAWAKWVYLGQGAQGQSATMTYLLWFLVVVEPLGAVALVFGFLTRWAAAGLAIIMVGAIVVLRLTMHASFFTMPQGIGLDYNTLILGICIVLMAFGAGNWSLDSMLNRKNGSQKYPA